MNLQNSTIVIEYEHQIDHLVYKLYNLTENEIEIVKKLYK